jgi:CheY-like chemotaxis protein
VVAVTAYAMKEDRERTRSAGFDGYVTKPLSVRSLPEQVRSYLTGGGLGP